MYTTNRFVTWVPLLEGFDFEVVCRAVVNCYVADALLEVPIIDEDNVLIEKELRFLAVEAKDNSIDTHICAIVVEWKVMLPLSNSPTRVWIDKLPMTSEFLRE